MTPTCIAEIGGNHRGDLRTAIRMIEVVGGYCSEHFALDGVRPRPYVKFQKRTCRLDLYPEWAAPHPNPAHAYGPTYLEHRQALEFSPAQHGILKAACDRAGVGYAVSVWDEPAAHDIASLEPDYIKIPSAMNLDVGLLGVVAREFSGPIHVSLGMTTRAEAWELTAELDSLGALDRTVLYACTSAYPVEFGDVCLGEIDWLKETYGDSVMGFGLSGHHKGVAVDMGAVALGVEYLERHFTLDRTWKGTDHAASLEPDGFRRLMRDAAAVRQAMGRKPESGVCEVEHASREKLKRETEAA